MAKPRFPIWFLSDKEQSSRLTLLDQVSVVAVPSPTLGNQPFAVVNNLNGRLSDQINTEVKWLLGEDYGLAGVVTLEQIGLDAFPVNATHKIVKFEVQKAVLRFLMLE